MIKKITQKKIAVVGLGYVGLPLGLLADRKGYEVYGIDCNKDKVNKINKRILPYEDKDLSVQLKKSSIEATTEWHNIAHTSIVIICVPTPVNHKPDLGPVKDACIEVAKHIQKGHVVVLESTVNPGVCDEIVLPLMEEISGMKCGVDFYLAHCPERINPGDVKWNVANIPRVIGSFDAKGLKKSVDFYESIIEAEIKPMKSLKEAEAVKIVENSFRDINIAFVNELAQSFSHLGIDVVNVINGASTKPFSFLAHYPGCGVGGHCIPVDPYYLIAYAKKNGFKHRFLALARKINNDMPKFSVKLVADLLKDRGEEIRGAKIAVLGLAYKANIGDCRESPSFEIIRELEKKGAVVSSFDPYVLEESTVKSMDEAVHNAHAVVVATDHAIFKELSPEYFIKHNVNVIIDGRNCLAEDKYVAAGIMYEGIGKKHIYQF
ncbi:MAG: nucleotide sugar dehydrogenase, partial [bacterium]|nr:nucleotide sugar dehydrogenase [bacterium]